MKKLGEFIVKKNIHKRRIIDEKSILYLYEKTIKEEYGKQGAQHLKASGYGNKKIFIKATNSNLANDLWLNKKYILQTINRELGGEEIEDITSD